jgi:hypothetical protein
MAQGDDKPQARLDFRSKEEFRLACKALSGRLHYLNRVSMGEQHFVWEMAETLARLGRVFEEHYDNADTNAMFGDGWTKGTLERDEARAYLLSLIDERG